MAGIAEQHDPAAAPAVVALAVVDRPQADVVSDLQHAAQVDMEAGEGFEHLVAAAGQRRCLAVPMLHRDDTDDVDLVASARHEIGQDVPVRPPPLGTVRYPRSAQPFGRKNRPLRHGADESRRLEAEQVLAHPGADAVGTDDDVGFDADAVLEAEADRLAALVEPDKAMVQRDPAGSNAAFPPPLAAPPLHLHVAAALTRF